jgi:rhodanese-related sulfurtransferase
LNAALHGWYQCHASHIALGGLLMKKRDTSLMSEVGPLAAWEILSGDKDARLIDVRTRPEWIFVGGPDVSAVGHSVIHAEWAGFPGMSKNPAFTETLMTLLDGHQPSQLLFICRSGVRSASAAQAVAQAQHDLGLDAVCTNVAEGFEGDLDSQGKRGSLNGWKARGLAWRQT